MRRALVVLLLSVICNGRAEAGQHEPPQRAGLHFEWIAIETGPALFMQSKTFEYRYDSFAAGATLFLGSTLSWESFYWTVVEIGVGVGDTALCFSVGTQAGVRVTWDYGRSTIHVGVPVGFGIAGWGELNYLVKDPYHVLGVTTGGVVRYTRHVSQLVSLGGGIRGLVLVPVAGGPDLLREGYRFGVLSFFFSFGLGRI